MKKHWSLALCLSLFMIFGLAGSVLAQTDSDGDLNADITDPFPTDPAQGGVYVGGTITYNVLLSGDLDASAFTGTVITITADGVTFDGNGHKIIAPNAGTVISLNGRSSVTVKNVTVAGNAASPSGEGILLVHSSNNTITNSTASHRVNGIRLTGRSNGNVVSDNLIQRTNSGGTALNVELTVGTAGGNQLLNNDVQGYSTGIAISRDNNFVLSGNTFGNNTIGIQFMNVSNRVVSSLVFPTTVGNPIRLDNVTGFTIDNVTVAGDAASPSGEGILLVHSSNNTITNSTASHRVNGIRLTGRSNGNVVSDNLIQRANSGGTALNVELTVGEAGGNQLLNNEVQGYSTGIAISRDNNSVLSGNTFGNNTIGIQFMNVSNRVVSNLVFPTTVGNPIRLDNVTDFTIDNVTVAGNAASPSGEGILLVHSSNNTITNSTASHRVNGIRLSGSSNGNVVNNNLIQGTSSGGTALNVDLTVGAAGGNQLLNNNVQGYSIGIVISRDKNFVLSGNTFGNNTIGIQFVNVSNRVISNLVFPTTVGNPIRLDNVTGFTIDNVTVAGDPASPSGEGILLVHSSNNTITNSTASHRVNGIRLTGSSNGNVVSDNLIQRTNSGGTALNVELTVGATGANQLLNNEVQGYSTGIAISRDNNFVLSGNTFGNNNIGIQFVNVSNRVVSNLVFPTTVGNPIRLDNVTDFTIDNVTVAGNAASPSGEGILLVHSSNNTITNSTASHRVNGIRLSGNSNGNVVSDNLIQRTNSGGTALNVELTVGAAGANQLLNNDVQGYSTGIAISRDNNFVLSGNTFGNNNIGIQFMNVSNRVISNLVFPTTVGNPIRLDNVTGFTIDHVTVAGNAASPSGEGILLVHSSNNTIINSTASHRVNGIRLSGTSNGNIVYHNNIFGNGKNIFSDQAIELSLNGEGNYWGRSCPGPLFVPGTDSNLPNVVDGFPYGTYDGWLGGGIPGCTTANAGQDKEICAGASTTIGGNPTASGGTAPYTYQWTPSAGLNDAIIANPTASPVSTTEYTVEVTGANGAKATDKVIVTVNPLPTANAGADQKLAYGQTVRLGGNPTASGGSGSYTYSWAPNTGLLDPVTVANPRVRPLSTTIYTVTVTDAKGCQAMDQVTITVHNFVFLSNGLVKINQNEDSKGDIHANGKIEFGKGKPGMHLGNLEAVDDVKIEDKNTIQGNALAGDELYLLGNAKVTGTKTAHASVATLPLPSLLYTAGGPNVTVAANTSKTLTPGSYGTIDLRTKATLLLSAGDYFMNVLSTDPNAVLSINATGPVNIYIVSDLEFDNNVQVKLTGGTSDNVLFTSLQVRKIDMGVNVIFYGTLINPNAEVHFGNNSKLKGAVFAASISLDPGVKFYHHTSPGTFPKESEVAESEVASGQSPATSYQLEQNYPNPFNPTTMIQFSVPRESHVRLKIYNSLGIEVATLVDRQIAAGTYKVNWDASRLASGFYLYRLEAEGFAQTKKLLLMK